MIYFKTKKGGLVSFSKLSEEELKTYSEEYGEPLTDEEVNSLRNPVVEPTEDQLLIKQKEDDKLRGFDFGGVMCSATGDDANKVIRLERSLDRLKSKGQDLPDLSFTVSNGSVININKDNVDDFIDQFMLFSLGFVTNQGIK